MAQKSKPKASGSAKLSVQSSLGVNEEDDDEVAASFLNVNRKIVKTAHEPKPPKDYVDSSTDVVEKADDQKSAKAEEESAKKPIIRDATSISMADADNLLAGIRKPKKDEDDTKEPAKSQDNKKADDGNKKEQNKDKAEDK
mmetsp:Transcript_68293/g.108430  ORF Transcript_68293/g.108430 Transcript_68293/m.108430 type:complete len:141 (+) Transcript_68293:114-536(+)|eukprot:CAMPEP_0197027362 /NCGR_PEP_ID=MMETSP1384-20130603/7285_1 /TAXON_ID=29189 /ORGANISM="Ammonia sp." /LENGTH=140 /DNA_ID=CAMNT_0042456193 /DNA_START=112 /DNA_END=534 /DNA_ORIENTATION=+